MKLKPRDWRGGFDIAGKKKEMAELSARMAGADFWNDRARADEEIKNLGKLQDIVRKYGEIEKGIAELKGNFSEDKFHELKRAFKAFEITQLFTGKYDKQSVVLSVYPGAGGEDAEDWARMLAEMYENYAKQKGYKITVLDDNHRSRTYEIKGDFAYGYLKHEMGVHRLVRISPFSPKKLRHTAFALVEIVPDLPAMDESKLQIPDRDLRFDFYRSGGPGGQNVNKVETAVRGIHIPTGLTVSSQAERSQAQNREKVLKLLKAKLFHLMEKNHVEELGSLRTKVKPEWGNQIRSYVLNPYQLVKDHRTDVETSQVDKVLAGDLDMFIEAEVEKLRMS